MVQNVDTRNENESGINYAEFQAQVILGSHVLSKISLEAELKICYKTLGYQTRYSIEKGRYPVDIENRLRKRKTN